jgi:hypothetical protein
MRRTLLESFVDGLGGCIAMEACCGALSFSAF